MSTETTTTNALADDDVILWGATEISVAINRDVRQTFHLLEKKLIPGKKVGKMWTASRNQLRRHFASEST